MKSSTLGKFLLIIIASLGVLFVIFLFYMIFIVKAGPINSSKANSVEVTGEVEKLYEGGVKDLVFKLKDDDNTYYINRALENGFDLNQFRQLLQGEEVTLWYAKHRSSPKGGGHMMQLQYLDSIYYTEWQIPLAKRN